MKRQISGTFFALVISLFFVFDAVGGEPIDIQPSSDGKLEASLTQAKVRRGVLTFRVAMKNVSSGSVEPEIRFKKVYFADIDQKKKYFPLKDANGMYIAGPRHKDWDGGTFKIRIAAGEMQIVWIKFPAPPDETVSVDLFIPGILPFEEIELQR